MKDAVSGEPMIGVSVRVKGTGSGTITDFDGNFTVKASKGDILVISYVGYKTLELDLKNKTTLGVISLGEDTETLEEVVVVGYGVQKKVSSVGSIATAKGDDLLKIGSVNSVSEALQGQMPGVVAIIPYTYEHTNFHTFQVGSVVNLEFDIIGKYLSP